MQFHGLWIYTPLSFLTKISHKPTHDSFIDKDKSQIFFFLSRGSCKTFMDSYSSSDKGKGKGFLSVGTSSSRSQNAAKRSPATYSHSQKKHKCSVYYSKQKPNTVAGSAIATTDEKQNQIAENQISAPKEDICTDVVSENWVTLKYANGINVNKNLTLPENFLGKEESALKNTVLIKNTSSECDLKEDLQTCMFPKETNLKTSENLVELKEQEFCPVKMSKKLPESHSSRNSPQQQPELQEISRKNSGNFFLPFPSVEIIGWNLLLSWLWQDFVFCMGQGDVVFLMCSLWFICLHS